MPEGLSVYSRGFTPLDNRYRTGDTMRTHKFFQSHATHYNTISNGVKPLDEEIPKEATPKG